MKLYKIMNSLLYTAAAIFILSGCAHLEAPIRDYAAEEWSDAQTEPVDELDVTPPGTVEVLIVESGPGWGTFGHAAIHLGKYAYSWDYGNGYILVRQSFRSFLYCYTHKHNRSVRGIVISFPEDAIRRLTENLDDEFSRSWNEGYNRGSLFLVNNCSTLVLKELIKAYGVKPKGWPPILIPDWMGKNVERTFELKYYNHYKKADPARGGS